jgi:hypothetical protein
MAQSALHLLSKYADAFRELINVKVWSSDKTVKDLLRLNSNDDWEFLCAAMDIIGDASAALDNVQRFGLSGATKYDDMGEKYLRLYGVLSATYIQQEAILTIYRIISDGNFKKIKAQFHALEIRQLRHKLSAHGTGYINTTSKAMEAYVPLRYEIGDTYVTAVNNTTSRREKINLKEAIDIHVALVIETLDHLIGKAIDRLYKGRDDKKKKHLEKLKDLRIMKAGGVVMGVAGGHNIIITLAGNRRPSA